LESFSYKNQYITKRFHKIERKRAELGMETLLPLTGYERKFYVEMKSLKYVWFEWKQLFKSCFFLLFSTMHLICILAADYSLFWLLTMIRIYGNEIGDIEEEEGKIVCTKKAILILSF
jgi:DC-STAMP-like protein